MYHVKAALVLFYSEHVAYLLRIRLTFSAVCFVLPGAFLRDLNLSNNDMGDAGAEAVATYVMQYKCVVLLNLSNNIHLGPVGVKGISSVRRQWFIWFVWFC